MRGRTCDHVGVGRVDQPQAQREERRGLEHPLFKLLQGDGRIQELPSLLIGEVGVDELLRVRQEVEVVEPLGEGRQTETAGLRGTAAAAFPECKHQSLPTFSQNFDAPCRLVLLPSRRPAGTTALPEARRSTDDRISHPSGSGPAGSRCPYCGPAPPGTRCPPLCKHTPDGALGRVCFPKASTLSWLPQGLLD